MLRPGPALLGGLAALWLGAALPLAQEPSLADLARIEQARRAAVESASRIYTNEDLGNGSGLTTGTSPAPSPVEREAGDLGASATSDGPTAATEDLSFAPAEDAERGEAYWRARITAAREARRRAELLAAALQNRVDGLWAEFTARDDPFQRAEIERQRGETLRELESTRAEADRLDQEILDIQEAARRAGALPGWLR